MTTRPTTTTRPAIVAMINNEIASDSEPRGFEVIYENLIIFVNYECEYRDAIGGSYNGCEFEHIAELISETITIADVWDTEGNEYPEIADELQAMFN